MTTVQLSPERRFRDAMGRFATGVTIISTVDDGEVHGMTANGFMSVSLDPQLVLVSVANRARMRGLLESSGVYGVSVLSRKHEGLSDHFAGRGPSGMDIGFVQAQGVPVIGDALASVAASIVDVRPAGDHTLFVGEVREFTVRPGEPLIFHSGSYAALEPEVDVRAHWAQDPQAWF